MFCKYCGAGVDDGAVFCQHCGAKVDGESVVEEKPKTLENKETVEKNKDRAANIACFAGLLVGFIGLINFVGIVMVGLSGFGHIYFFDGYKSTAVLTIISIITMLVGALSFLVKCLLNFGLKIGKFAETTVKGVFLVLFALLFVGFSVWGCIKWKTSKVETEDSSSESTYTYMDFYTVYADCGCESPWATVNSDYLIIDTNPYDYNYNSDPSLSTTYATSAIEAIKKINAKFDLPSYLYQDMIETSALNGRETYETPNYRVTWTYHPDKGLEVRYVKK